MRNGRRMIGAALAAGILAAPASALAVAPVAALQDDRLPVVPLNQLQARLDLFKQTGAKVARVDLFWSEIATRRPKKPTDPRDPAYNWTRADAILGGLVSRGIRPIVSVYSTPRWAAGVAAPRGQAFNPNMPKKPNDFGFFMQALATRYNGKSIPPGYSIKVSVRHFEIWNEPNLQLFFRPQYKKGKNVSIKNYAALVRAAYPRIKKGNRSATVIIGVTGPKGKSNNTGQGTIDWMRGLRGQNLPFDAYSQHIYPAAGPRAATTAVPSWSTIPQLLKELDQFKNGRKKPMYITEAGYTTAVTPYRRVKVSFAQQKTFLQQIWSLPTVKQPRIPAIVWFNLQDNPAWPGGLLTFGGAKKPSYAAFQAIATRSVVPPSLRP